MMMEKGGRALSKLTKLLMMTTSDHDGEALNAMRMANAMLLAAGINWAEFVAAPDRIEREQRQADLFERPIIRDEQIDDMLTQLLAIHLNPAQREFVTGLQKYWQERGYLTERQFDALVTTAERLLRRERA